MYINSSFRFIANFTSYVGTIECCWFSVPVILQIEPIGVGGRKEMEEGRSGWGDEGG